MAADDPREGHIPGPAYLTTEELRRDVSALREIIQARLDGMDRAAVVLADTVNRTPTVIQTEITHVRELINEKLGSLGGQAEEKFTSIALQFAERDVRTTQASTASAQALAAALQAAKEAVFEQAQAAAKAAEKTELSFTKQIDQILLQIKIISDAFSDRIAELKERIDRGEGSRTGTTDAQAGQIARGAQFRASASVAVAAFSSLIAIAAIVTVIALHK